jgi:fumarylacetoacetate (FAA) hydrolase
MKFVSYFKDDQDQLALLIDGLLYDTDLMHPDLPVSINMFLNYWEDLYPIARAIEDTIKGGKISKKQGIDYESVEVLAPVPHPTSFRNAYAFQQLSVLNSIPQSNQYPVFNFANHNSINGPGEVSCMPDYFEKLDFELQVAIVIGKPGKNIKAADADSYIAGYTILNNFVTRRFQNEEIPLNAIAANGRDFATIIGPMLVTPDDLEAFKIECKPNHTGHAYNLSMKCRVNDVQVSESNLSDMEWTFAEIIERTSYGVQLFPGDIISSGVVRTGCFFELNNDGKLNNPGYEEQWLKEGDVIEMEIENLGKLSSAIVRDESDFSIFGLNKEVTDSEEDLED